MNIWELDKNKQQDGKSMLKGLYILGVFLNHSLCQESSYEQGSQKNFSYVGRRIKWYAWSNTINDETEITGTRKALAVGTGWKRVEIKKGLLGEVIPRLRAEG